MSDCLSSLPAPNEIDEKVWAPSGSDTDPDPVSEGIAALLELTAAGVEVDGELQIAESTWVIYGHTSYDGEVIVGEYHAAAEAAEVLRAAPGGPDHDRPVR
jgi:hypothetical protein